jgi:hypothetical protein
LPEGLWEQKSAFEFPILGVGLLGRLAVLPHLDAPFIMALEKLLE